MTRPLLAIALTAVALTAAAARPATSLDGMAPYVYPQNAPARVDAPVWTPDEKALVRLDDGRCIVTVDPQTGNVVDTLFNVLRTRENAVEAIEGFVLSPDASKILVYTDRKAVYRRSFTARWYTYDRHSRILRPLSTAFERQRAPLFSPDSRMVAFTAEDNNIHIRKIDYNSEVAVTRDGSPGNIINGVPDWTYEEEFATALSMTWAPDALTLCYLKYDESRVPLYNLTLYAGACNPNDAYALYPGLMSYKYPVAGQPNARVSVHVYDVDNRTNKQVQLPEQLDIEYIPHLEYAHANDRLLIAALNRDQNRLHIITANPRATTSRVILTEHNPTGWIEPDTYERLALEPDAFVMTSSRTGYAHLYRYSYAGALLKQLTQGEYDVTAYYGTDAEGNVYYQSTATGPRNRTVSVVDAKGRDKLLSAAEGTTDAIFSPGMQRAQVTFSDVNTPPRTTLVDVRRWKEVRLIEDNAALAARCADMPRRRFFSIPATAEGPELCAYIVSDGTPTPKPTIIYQYSGPGSQEVRNRWTCDWENWFAANGFNVVCIDPRGTGYRGRAFMNAVYQDLGHYETLDLLRGARYSATLPGVDGTRMGVYGWSYGGYEALMCAQAEGSPFAAVVAIAPVTDWRLYDTVYTERYMLTPQQNPEGYEASAPMNHAADLKCPALLIHGTLDDNVHPANTIEYAARLTAAGILPDMLLMAGMNHSINYCDARLAVYSRLYHFMRNNL